MIEKGDPMRQRFLYVILPLAAACGMLWAQTPRVLKPGFNLFSKAQDVQMGQDYAKQVRQQAPIIKDQALNDYIKSLGKKLAAQPEADKYPYTFEVVHDATINAFALPGGSTFVHTTLITAAENEAQLVGVMAHEIAHVALRHGTNQMSKANLIQLPAMLGAAAGQMKGGWVGMLSELGIGLGANSVLMKFSRNAERDADLLGARMMQAAGYNPLELARFFEILEKDGGSRGPQFFSDHPNPGNRIKEIEKEIQLLPKRAYDGDSGQFSRMQDAVRKLPPAPKQQPQQQGGSPGPAPAEPPRITASRQFKELKAGTVSISYPENWKAVTDQQTAGATIAPAEGIHQGPEGQSLIGFGAIVGFSKTGARGDLSRQTEEFVRSLSQQNQGMRVRSNSRETSPVDGNRALVTVLVSPSPYRNVNETDTVVTVSRPEGLFHVIFIAPESAAGGMESVYNEMLRSIRFAR